MKCYQYNNKGRQIHRRYTSGFTLVELMVAVALGLILSTAVTVMYIGTSDVFRVQAQYAQAQQNGRYAINVLNRVIRQAGFCGSPTGIGCAFPPANSPLTVLSIQGFRPAPATPPPPIPGASAPRTQATAFTAQNGDALRVAFYGKADRSVLDCLGREVPANTLAVNTFRVAPEDADASATGPPALFCHSALFTVNNAPVAPAPSTMLRTGLNEGNQEEVIAHGISRLALAYIVGNQIWNSTTNAPVQPSSFQVVRDFPTGLGTAPNTDRDRVAGVRISLVSLTRTKATQGKRTETLSLLAPTGHPLAENIGLGGDADQGVRIYNSTVALRNRLAFVN